MKVVRGAVMAIVIGLGGAVGCGDQSAAAVGRFTVGGGGAPIPPGCSVIDNGNGSATIDCIGGAPVTVKNGVRCAVARRAAGTHSVSCCSGRCP